MARKPIRNKAAKPKPPRPAPARRPGRPLGPVVRGLLTAVAAVGLVVGVMWVGQQAGLSVADRGRYAARFADLDCDPPPGLDRPTFLAEVRYLSGFPETFQAVDPHLGEQLTAAFRKHPWVDDVPAVRVGPDRAVRVDLRFRTPALAVPSEDGKTVRLVDGRGVLLPPAPVPPGLPLLADRLSPPKIVAGQMWLEAKRAAELAAQHKPARIERKGSGWRLVMPDGKAFLVRE